MKSLSLPFPAPVPTNWKPPTLPSLSGTNELGFDTESNGLKWWSGDRVIGVSIYSANPSCPSEPLNEYYPCSHLGGGNIPEGQVKEWCRRELRDKLLVGHNIKHDIHMMREWGVDLEAQNCRVADTMHYAALLDDHRKKFALSVLAPKFLNEPKVGTDLDETQMAWYHAGTVAPRAIHDARQTWQLREKMMPMMDKEGLGEVKQLEEDLLYPTCEMEKNGTKLNLDLLEQWHSETADLELKAAREITKEVGFAVNPDSPDDLFKITRMKGLPISRTPNGAPSFTDAIIRAYQHPLFDKIKDARNLSKLRSKYINPYYLQSTGDTLRYALHQLRSDDGGTISGRYSSTALLKKENIGVNIQQVMKAAKQIASYGKNHIIRQLFVPDSGLWFSADAEQIEYRLFAHYANSADILKRYAEDPRYSFHKMIQEMLKPFAPHLTYRQIKDLNFATIYGAGVAKLALMLKFVTEEQYHHIIENKQWRSSLLQSTKDVKRIYNREIPEGSSLLEKASSQAKRIGYVRTLLGRRCRFPQNYRLHKALNGVIQGGAADIMKRKIVELHRERKYTQFLMRFPVHDEINGDIPDEYHAKRVEEILDTQTTPTKVPILWGADTGTTWYDCAA